MSKKKIILLTGRIASGKSTLCDGLVKDHEFTIIRTRDLLESVAKKKNKDYVLGDRAFLQRFGRELDESTQGKWVLEEVQHILQTHDRILIDSLRIQNQIDSFRNSYGYTVVHIHIHAEDEWRLNHYIERETKKGISADDARQNFYEFAKDPTEKGVSKFLDNADLVIYSADSADGRDQVVRAASFLRLLPKVNFKNVDVIIGGQFGSEGKGQIAAYMAPEYEWLVRVGGPNAGHKVYNEPNPDVFHIIPSGANKAKESKLIIGPGAVISEQTILEEIRKFEIEPHRLFIDENATIISEADILYENEHDKIGSTKQGVGAATANNILARLRNDDSNKAKNSNKLKNYICNAHSLFEEINSKKEKILIEGTQGTLLSLHHGYYPHVTSRDTTVSGCLAECGIGPQRVRKIVMVARRYPIRVQNPTGGTSGDFYSTEIDFKTIASRSQFPEEEIKKIEKTSVSLKTRRIAEFSWYQFRRACELNTPTDIALTFADYISYSNQNARRYDQLTKETTKFIDEMERCAGVNVSLISTRFAYRSIIDRRNWI